MKNKNLEKLVIALRSGKYKQGRGELNDNDKKFCCLGVACEVAMENGVKVEKTLTFGEYSYDLCRFGLPKNVVKYFNLQNEDGSFGKNTIISNTLTYMNDVNKLTFNQIADFIEQNEDKLTIN